MDPSVLRVVLKYILFPFGRDSDMTLSYDSWCQILCFFYTCFIFSSCTGYSEFGYHLNKTGRAMVYSCSWPVYQTYAGLQVSNNHNKTLDIIKLHNKWPFIVRNRVKIFSSITLDRIIIIIYKELDVEPGCWGCYTFDFLWNAKKIAFFRKKFNVPTKLYLQATPVDCSCRT